MQPGRLVATLIAGVSLAAWSTWTDSTPGVSSWEVDTYETYDAAEERIDPSSRRDVLARISKAGLYQLDVDDITLHIHATVRVYVDGVEQIVPQIGVDMDTVTAAPVHTHDDSGVVHIETDSAHPQRPTVYDFLALWTYTRDRQDVCRFFAKSDSCTLIIYVNGEETLADSTFVDGDAVDVYVYTGSLSA